MKRIVRARPTRRPMVRRGWAPGFLTKIRDPEMRISRIHPETIAYWLDNPIY